jgi:hypothetical protein
METETDLQKMRITFHVFMAKVLAIKPLLN